MSLADNQFILNTAKNSHGRDVSFLGVGYTVTHRCGLKKFPFLTKQIKGEGDGGTRTFYLPYS